MSLTPVVKPAAPVEAKPELSAEEQMLATLKDRYKDKQAFLAKRLNQFIMPDASVIRPNEDRVYVPKSEAEFNELVHYAKQPMDYVIPLF